MFLWLRSSHTHTEVVQIALVVSPIFDDLYKQFQKYLSAEKFFDIEARPGADILYSRALFSDNDLLLRRFFNIDRTKNLNNIGVGIVKKLGHNGRRVWNFLASGCQYFFAHHLGR